MGATRKLNGAERSEFRGGKRSDRLTSGIAPQGEMEQGGRGATNVKKPLTYMPVG